MTTARDAGLPAAVSSGTAATAAKLAADVAAACNGLAAVAGV